MIRSALNLKVRGVFAHCDLSASSRFFHGGRDECGLSTGIVTTAPGLPLSVTITDVCGGVDLTSPTIKRNLNILSVSIDDAVGLFQNIIS